MTEAGMHRPPAGSDERCRPELASPFSELLPAPIITVVKTEPILTTPFERQPAPAAVATDPVSERERVPGGGLAWSSPASCTTSVADVVSAPRTRARSKRR
jgi:hypothetical protein